MIDWKKLEKVMLRLGFDDYVKGTDYLREAVRIWDARPHLALSKELYPEIARKYGTRWTCVERAIRHASESAMLRGEQKAWEDYFGASYKCEIGRPTCGQLISRLARVACDAE